MMLSRMSTAEHYTTIRYVTRKSWNARKRGDDERHDDQLNNGAVDAADVDQTTEIDNEPTPAEPEPPPHPDVKPPAKTAANMSRDVQSHMVATLLKSDQPLSLEEISRTTKIPQAQLFQILKDEQFERDTSGFYWIAK